MLEPEATSEIASWLRSYAELAKLTSDLLLLRTLFRRATLRPSMEAEKLMAELSV